MHVAKRLLEPPLESWLRSRFGASHQHYRAQIAPRALWRDLRSDGMLVSYPKCGRTWLRFLLGNALVQTYGIEAPVDDVLELEPLAGQNGAPWIRVTHEGHPDHLLPREMSRRTFRYLGKPVLFLVRDPRDVVVSLYFQHSRRELRFEGTLSEFVTGARSGLKTLVAYYNAWVIRRTWTGRFMLMKYEDLKRDTLGELRRAADFFEIPTTDPILDEAVQASTFERMRAIEAGQTVGSSRLRPAEAKDETTFKTRKGKVGGYREHLSPQECEWVDRYLREHLDSSYNY